MPNETQLWQLLRQNLSGFVHSTRIENPRAGTGISDVLMCRNSRYVMVELKIVKSNVIRFQPSQIAWISRHLRAGGQVKIVARRGDFDIMIFQGNVIYAQVGSCVRVSDALALGVWTRPWPWEAIENMIFGQYAA